MPMKHLSTRLSLIACYVASVSALQQADLRKVAGEQGSAWCTEDTLSELRSSQADNVNATSLGDLCYDVLDLPFATDILDGAILPIGHGNDFSFFRVDSDLTPKSSVSVTRTKPLLWLHIHKAGGTLMCALAALAGERVVQPTDGNCNWAKHDGYQQSGREGEYATSCKTRADYFKRGGYTWGSIERELWESDACADDFDYGVMLREPVSLMSSMMNFCPEKGKGFLVDLDQQLKNSTSTTKSEWPEWKMFDNFQVRLLSGALDAPAGTITESHLEKAKQFVADNFDIVARLEDLPHAGTAFVKALSWAPDMVYHIGETRNSSPRRLEFTSSEKAALIKLNKYDYALYEDVSLKL